MNRPKQITLENSLVQGIKNGIEHMLYAIFIYIPLVKVFLINYLSVDAHPSQLFYLPSPRKMSFPCR
jgi:hypothetical protein